LFHGVQTCLLGELIVCSNLGGPAHPLRRLRVAQELCERGAGCGGVMDIHHESSLSVLYRVGCAARVASHARLARCCSLEIDDPESLHLACIRIGPAHHRVHIAQMIVEGQILRANILHYGETLFHPTRTRKLLQLGWVALAYHQIVDIGEICPKAADSPKHRVVSLAPAQARNRKHDPSILQAKLYPPR